MLQQKGDINGKRLSEKVEEKKLLGRHGRRREVYIKLILQHGSQTIFIATGHPHLLL